MRRGPLLVLIFFLSGPLGAQSSTGGLLGLGSDGAEPLYASWLQLSVDSFVLGQGVLPVPRGRWTFDWRGFQVEPRWVGWKGSTAGGVTTVLGLGGVLPSVGLSWETLQMSADTGPLLGWVVTQSGGPWFLGGGQVHVSGPLTWGAGLPAGSFRLVGSGLVVGWSGWRVGVGRLQGEARGLVNALGANLLDLDDRLDLWVGGVAGQVQGRFANWQWNVDYGLGVGWVSAGQFKISHQWWGWVTTPTPGFALQTSEMRYTLQADPGYWVYLHPRLSLALGPGWSLSASRWLPWGWGWHVTQGNSQEAAPSAQVGSSTDTWDLWSVLGAGTTIEFFLRW